MLHQPIIFLSCRHYLPRFKHVMRARLFHIHIFARLAPPYGLQGVIMIWRRNGNRIDGFVFEQLAQVGVRGRPLLAHLFDLGDALVQNGFINVADGCNFHIRHPRVMAYVGSSLAAHAHTRHAHRIIWTGKTA
jgi:hypothetical protein